MKKNVSTILINLVICIIASTQSIIASTQNRNDTLKIMDITPNAVEISGVVKKQYDYFNPSEQIEWKTTNAIMKVKAQVDLKYKDSKGNDEIWYKSTIRTILAADNKTSNKFSIRWWIRHNPTMSKGNSSIFENTFEMYEDELVIIIPKILEKGEGYRFESVINGKSFYCEKHDEKPLIRITKEMLDSIGFNKKSIELYVWYVNYYDEDKVKLNKPMKIIYK